jgi:hypothetical protein
MGQGEYGDRAEGAKLPSGGCLLLETASALGISEEDVDHVLTAARQET